MTKISDWKAEINKYKFSIMMSLVFLGAAVVLNYIAGNYVDKAGSVSAPDLILDHLPVVDLTVIYLFAYAAMFLFLLCYPLFYDVKRFHIVIGHFSLLVLIRSFFITLTHLKPPVDAIVVTYPYLNNILVFQNDLFFSGHTAIPFLGYLIYREEPIGKVFLWVTVLLAATVLLMHVHYSIDVFAAIFISYGSYVFGNWFFKKINYW